MENPSLAHAADPVVTSQLQDDVRSMLAITSLFSWLQNMGLLPPIEDGCARDLLRAMSEQLKHEDPDFAVLCGDRKLHIMRVTCRTLVLIDCALRCAMTGVGCNERGQLSVPHILEDLRCCLIVPLVFVPFAAELHDLAFPKFFGDVVEALMRIMGVKYDPHASDWVIDQTRTQQPGKTAKQGNYWQRIGFLADPPSRRNSSNNNGRGNRDNDVADAAAADDGTSDQSMARLTRRIEELANVVAGQLTLKLPVDDIVYALAFLTRETCRPREPGFDFARIHSATAKQPGLIFDRDGVMMHQRLPWQFHRNRVYELVAGLQAPGTRLGRGLRGLAPTASAGFFSSTDWDSSVGAAPSVQREVALLNRDIRIENRLIADLKHKGPDAPKPGVSVAMFTQAKAAAQQAHDRKLRQHEERLALLKTATVPLTQAGVTYRQWQIDQGLIMEASSSVVQDWFRLGRQMHAEFLRKYSVVPAPEHWTNQMGVIQSSFGNAVAATRVLEEYVKKQFAHDARRGAFMPLLSDAVERVTQHGTEVAKYGSTMASASRTTMSLVMLRNLFNGIVGKVFMCPPLAHLIGMSPDAVNTYTPLADSVFQFHRELRRVRVQWDQLRLLVSQEGAALGGRINLFPLRHTNNPCYALVLSIATSLVMTLRNHVITINNIAKAISAPPLSTADVRYLLQNRVECDRSLATYTLRTDPPDAEVIEAAVRAIYEVLRIPSQPAPPVVPMGKLDFSSIMVDSDDEAEAVIEEEVVVEEPPLPPAAPPVPIRLPARRPSAAESDDFEDGLSQMEMDEVCDE